MSSGLNLLPNQAKFQAKKIRLQKKVNHFVWIFRWSLVRVGGGGFNYLDGV